MPRAAAVFLAGLLLPLTACTDGAAPPPEGSASVAPTMSGPTAPPSDASRPAGPAADLSEEFTAGAGPFVGSGGRLPLDASYVEHEYVAAGRATSYVPQGELTGDGRWTFRPDREARYRTRVLVRSPADAAAASGVVLVEWLNVSGGLDADPDFQTLREEIVRQGHTWVGVSAQQIGVEGGPVAVTIDVPGAADLVGKGLKSIDPARYGSLRHPGDAFAYDIYTQVARAVRGDGPVLAVGESQSAFALVTYVNGVQPLTHAFDGFFVHSRGAAPLALPEGGEPADIAGSLFGTPTTFRTDTDVPVFDLQTESDVVGVLGSAFARQPDTDSFRLWEVAGTGHADRHLLGDVTADAVDCGAPVNDGPLHVVAKAALRHLVDWVRDGTAPPTAPLLTYGADGVERDADGIALGGLRTPPVDVPVRVLSGEPGGEDVACLLFGSTRPMPPGRIAELHRDRAGYVLAYGSAVDQAIAEGYVLAEDRDAIEAYRHEELVNP